jgi:hypothetical protein
MGLTKAQQILITKARNPGGSELGIFLDEEICAYLTGTIIADLGLSSHFPELPTGIPPFFSAQKLDELRLPSHNFAVLLEKLFTIQPDTDIYFYCVATLHKARLKYAHILEAQAISTIDQVGPRGLLQYGLLSPKVLASLLFWRKWMFDIDVTNLVARSSASITRFDAPYATRSHYNGDWVRTFDDPKRYIKHNHCY